MTLIKSISGIRGTIGGIDENLSPSNVVKFVSAFALLNKQSNKKDRIKIVIGRDARVSGEMVKNIVVGTLLSMGVDVVDLGLATTPTIEMAVLEGKATAGIIISASHNPGNWNALKLLNGDGEFVSTEFGKELLQIAEVENFQYATVDNLGKYFEDNSALEKHIDKILNLKLVDVEGIRRANFRVAVDGINSVGGLAIPILLQKLGVDFIEKINCDPTGLFAHNPEPLSENLSAVCDLVREKKCDVGFVVDPDVDRLAIIQEDGQMFGEEYTLVAVADYVLNNLVGNTVSNLSSTRALRDITVKAGGEYYATAVGEVNVVEKMKEVGAVIGGEGNGGVIFPELHYGRDALVGVALFLSYLAKSKLKVSELKKKYSEYYMSKNKIELSPELNVDLILRRIEENYKNKDCEISTIDGVKIDFFDSWIHLRKSNTEPIIRIYTESVSQEKAGNLALEIIKDIKNICKQ